MSRASDLEVFLKRMPYVGLIGMECEVRGDEMTACLPYREANIGNPALPALHGGVIGSFLELTAMAQVFLLSETQAMPKTIDLTVDYFRSGRPEDLFARADIMKQGRRVVNVRAEAWQGERAKPIAALTCNMIVV